MEASPAAELHAVRSCWTASVVNADAFEVAPALDPAKEPVTFTFPPAPGKTKPAPAVPPGSALYSENVTTLGEIVLGVHRTVSVSAEAELINDVQPLLDNFSTDVAEPPVTCATLDPVVVQFDAFKVILVVSARDPINVRGGVKVAEPVTVPQVMLPVASPFELPPPLEHAVANTAVIPSAATTLIVRINLRPMDSQSFPNTVMPCGSTSTNALMPPWCRASRSTSPSGRTR